MDYLLEPLSADDREPVIDVFNYYVEHSFAAYPETPLPYSAFDFFLKMASGYPSAALKERSGGLVGFGFLHAHSPIATLARTAEITSFIRAEHTGKGLGKRLLDYLERGAVEKGLTTLLASISSLNPGSIRFHQKNGFVECGCFKRVGVKKGQWFDTVWLQKALAPGERQ